MILTLLIALFTVMHQSSMVSFCFSMSFVILFWMFAKSLSNQIHYTILLLAVLSLVHVSINALLSRNAQIGFSYFKKLIMFYTTVFYLYFVSFLKTGESGRKYAEKVPIIIGVILILSYFVFGNRGLIAHKITLGFHNPNTASAWLVCLIFYLFYAICKYNNAWTRLFYGIIIGLLSFLLYKAFGRASFFAMAGFFGFLVYGVLRDRWQLHEITLWIIALFPVLFLILYLQIIEVDWFVRLFHFLVEEGKTLTSRVKIWRHALSLIKDTVIIGNYSGISNGAGVSQMHNTHLDVLCSYGLLPLILFVVFLHAVLQHVNRQISCLEQYIAFCGFIGIILMGSMEAALVSGVAGLNILSGNLLLLAASPTGQERNAMDVSSPANPARKER